MKRLSLLLVVPMLGLIMGLPGCIFGDEDNSYNSSKIVPIGPQPITGVIDNI